ncbi:MAG: M48 family metallopeptidase, partial [Candidatus Competibacteraceae bacterium]|nr:M48 family metallopeptidase [Candidatus Competibacteraceae bacterium]
REAILAAWYREQLRQAVSPLIARWEPVMGVKVRQFSIRRMKTRWGSCTPKTGRIRINTELAKKPRDCLEYLIVHEMVHLLEPAHNARFKALMDQFLPNWPQRRELLNQLPVRLESGSQLPSTANPDTALPDRAFRHWLKA